jgi:hypothetical protein
MIVKLRISLLAALLWGAPALAQETSVGETTAEPQAAASVHFQAGIALAQRGELAAAVTEFEAAYAASPHYSVLYNIAQTEVARGRFVQAVAAFERYLATGELAIPLDRRKAVLGLIAEYEKNIGALQLEIAAPGKTRVWLDGVELRGSELTRPVALSAGRHSLLSTTGRSEPAAQEVTIKSQETTKARVGSDEVRLLAHASILITCGTPDVLVSIDTAVVGRTPIARPLVVASGQRRVRFSRAGYGTTERIVPLNLDGFAIVDCGMKVERALSPDVAGRLRVRTHPVLARATVDGVAFVGDALPAGRHELIVEHEGYVPHRALLSIEARHERQVDVALHPTPAKLRRDRRRRAGLQTLSYALGGGGAALLLAGGSLAWWNQGRFEALDQGRPNRGNPDPNRVIAIQRTDDVSIGLATVGIGLVIGGVWAYLAGDKSD